MANPITRQQALKQVESFLASKGKVYRAPSRRSSSVDNTESGEYYYVFNIGKEEGYVIASGDDCAPAILGYSDKGYIGDSIPDNMRGWLDEYKSQIQYMQENGISYSGSVTSDNPTIAPLLTTTWNQGDPYNINCPDFFTYGKCVTGCVATAMAQVMYYHRHSSVTQTTTEIPAYVCKTNWHTSTETLGHISVNAIPAGSIIDWDNMLNAYTGTSTSVQKQAIANLMAYCGASVKMEYRNSANGGSGAASEDVPVALKKYFDYNEDISLEYRENYTTDDAWNSLIYSELSKGNPVYYSGLNSSSGHAFVCDGYDGNGYFHINWGWGGQSDGNFLLSALDPSSQGIGGSSSGYNQNQTALIGAIPNGEIVKLTTHDLLLTGSTSFQIGSSSSVSVPVRLILKNSNDATYNFDYAIGLYSYGNFVEVLQNLGTYNNLSSGSQMTRNVNLSINTNLADGTYQLIPLSKKAGADKWQKNLNSSEKFITLVKRDGAMTFCVGTPSISGTIINFADANVKNLCVQNWDTNGDGELSTEEAAVVTDLGTIFKSNYDITSFEELEYFTGLTSIASSAFRYCSVLTSITIPSGVTSIGNYALSSCTALTTIKVADGNTVFDSRNNCNAIIKKSDNTLIAGCKNTVIPSSVTSIGSSAFLGCSTLSSIIIPSSVTSIGSSAFSSCSALTSINIPNSVTSIGSSTFSYCYALSSINIPNSVTSIGSSAFSGCSALTSITIPSSVTSIGSSAFSYCSALTSITIPSNVTSIGDNPFRSCDALATITVASTNTAYDSRDNCNAIIRKSDNTLITGCKNTVIPNNVTSIGNYAFSGYKNFTSIIIPSSVTSIGSSAFAYCSELTSIDIPSSVTSIGSSAFSSCSALTSITIPGNVTSIGSFAFSGCSNLTSVTVGMSVPVSINQYVFSNRANATLYVPKGSKFAYEAADYWKEFKQIEEYTDDAIINFADANVKSLCVQNWDTNGDGELSMSEAAAVTDVGSKFRNNGNITSFEELEYFTGLTSIGSSAFRYCSALTSITIPSNVISIGNYALEGCTALTTIKVIDGNTIFDSRNNCNAIIKKSDNTLIVGCKNTVIPSGVTSIGNYAFYNCSGLSSITIPSSVTSIGNSAFFGCNSLTTIAIPSSVTTIEGFAFMNCSGLSSFTIPNNVTSIGSCAFRGCRSLTSINIPSSVTSIDSSVFAGCSALATITVASNNTVYDSRNNCNAIIRKSDNTLISGCKNTVIPDNITSIYNYAFRDCSNLSSIIIPDGVTTIGTYAFSGCSSLISIIIPNGVISISDFTFGDCTALSSITLPKSITSIQSNAFYQCSNLTSVTVEMPAPVAITDRVFNNRTNATLYVPYGSKAAYESADYWKEFMEIVEINNDNEPSEIEVTDISKIDNVIYIEETEVRAGTQATISLKMKNTKDIRGFQFDLYLPEGVTAVKSAKGKIQGALSDGRLPDEDEHTLTLSEQPDGAIRFLCSSQFEETFTGTDGEIATLQVNVADNMEDGDYAIQLKDVKLTENDISKFYLTDLVTQKLTVITYISGDISGDGKVDVTDYTGVANHIHGKTPTGFNAKAADVNTDNAIDVLDYTGIANIIHTGSVHGSNHARLALSPNDNPLEVTDISNMNNVIYITPFTATAGSEEYSISINMKNTADIRGFQLDLYLPEGVTALKSAKGRIQGTLNAGRLPEEDEHELTLSEQPDGAIRFLCSSLYEETFTGNDGEIATLKVKVDSEMPTGDYAVILKDVKLTENDISIYYFTEQVNTTMTIDGKATGISQNKHDAATNNQWYTLDGRKIGKNPTEKGVYIKNDRKKVIR